MRVAALELPELLLQLALREHPARIDRPVVVVEKRRGQELIVAATPAAQALGASPGLTVAQAKALAPGLEVVPADHRRAARALRELAEALLSLAPVVELAPPEALLLDASAARLVDLPHEAPVSMELFPAGQPVDPDGRLQRERERLWAEAVLSCAHDCGLAGLMAVADTPEAARVLAAQLSLPTSAPLLRTRVVPPGRQAQAMTAVPLWLVTRLGAAAQAARTAAAGEPAIFGADERPLWPALPPTTWALLEELGLKRLGRLRELPPRTLVERLGTEADWLLTLAGGGRPRPLRPFRPLETIIERVELDGRAEEAEGLVFALRPLAERLAARLAGRGLVAARLDLVLETEPAGLEEGAESPEREAVSQRRSPGGPAELPPLPRVRTRLLLELARPTAQARIVLELLRERLLKGGLEAAVLALELEVLESAARRDQLVLGERPRAQEALESVLGRLRSRLGEAAVGTLECQPRWLPEEATGVRPFDLEAPPRLLPPEPSPYPPPGPDGAMTAQERERPPGSGLDDLLPRPTRLLPPEEITAELDPAGRPRAVAFRGRRHRVLDWTMPEKLVTGWWGEPGVRDYVSMLLGDGARIWVFRDAGGRWWLQGVHD